MTPTEDDGSKRRGLAPVTRKKRLPEALSWRLCPQPLSCTERGGEGEKAMDSDGLQAVALPLSVQERGLGGEANRHAPFSTGPSFTNESLCTQPRGSWPRRGRARGVEEISSIL
jgi:hypothetical protein